MENGAGAGADDDGRVTLLSEADFEVCASSASKIEMTGVKRVLAGTSFPLEIGYTSASRTYLHLIQERCVARWPYGKTSLSLLRADLSFLTSLRKEKEDENNHVASNAADNRLPLSDYKWAG